MESSDWIIGLMCVCVSLFIFYCFIRFMYVAHMGEMKKAYKILDENLKGKYHWET